MNPSTLIWTAVEAGGLLSNLASRLNEWQAESYINDAHTYLQRVGPILQEQREYIREGVRERAVYYADNWFGPVETYYWEDLKGSEILRPVGVDRAMQEVILPRFDAVRNLCSLAAPVTPGVYRTSSTAFADTGTAALLYGLADGIEGFIQANGMRLNAKQYAEECHRIGRQAAQALDDAVDAINAFFGMIAMYEGLKNTAHEYIVAECRWQDMAASTRLAIRQFIGLFGLMADFWEYTKALL